MNRTPLRHRVLRPSVPRRPRPGLNRTPPRKPTPRPSRAPGPWAIQRPPNTRPPNTRPPNTRPRRHGLKPLPGHQPTPLRLPALRPTPPRRRERKPLPGPKARRGPQPTPPRQLVLRRTRLPRRAPNPHRGRKLTPLRPPSRRPTPLQNRSPKRTRRPRRTLLLKRTRLLQQGRRLTRRLHRSLKPIQRPRPSPNRTPRRRPSLNPIRRQSQRLHRILRLPLIPLRLPGQSLNPNRKSPNKGSLPRGFRFTSNQPGPRNKPRARLLCSTLRPWNCTPAQPLTLCSILANFRPCWLIRTASRNSESDSASAVCNFRRQGGLKPE